MRIPIPHFLLLSEALVSGDREEPFERAPGGRWRFVLEAADGSTVLEAEDSEAVDDLERLALLSVVRGLEALDEPARVTLVTSSRYVSHGLRLGLAEWRESDWQWERFGERVPVKNDDLWRRVDQALRFHTVECRLWRIDRGHGKPLRDRRVRPGTSSRWRRWTLWAQGCWRRWLLAALAVGGVGCWRRWLSGVRMDGIVKSA